MPSVARRIFLSLLILGQRREGEEQGEMPPEGDVGCQASGPGRARNRLLQLWGDWVQGQVDLAKVLRAVGGAWTLSPTLRW